MRDQPDGIKLLDLARAAIFDELLPALPEDRRYTARLIANAMAIAARELAAGDAPSRAERAALDTLVGDGDGAEPLNRHETESLEETLQRLTWRLAAEIRAGGRDGDRAVWDVLRAGAARRLGQVNPKRLGTRGESTPA